MAADRRPEPLTRRDRVRRSLAADLEALRRYAEAHPLPTGGLTVVGPEGTGQTIPDPEDYITELCKRNPCM